MSIYQKIKDFLFPGKKYFYNRWRKLNGLPDDAAGEKKKVLPQGFYSLTVSADEATDIYTALLSLDAENYFPLVLRLDKQLQEQGGAFNGARAKEIMAKRQTAKRQPLTGNIFGL